MPKGNAQGITRICQKMKLLIFLFSLNMQNLLRFNSHSQTSANSRPPRSVPVCWLSCMAGVGSLSPILHGLGLGVQRELLKKDTLLLSRCLLSG